MNSNEIYTLMRRAHNVAQSDSAHPHNKIGSVLKLSCGNIAESSNLWLSHFAPDYDVSVKLGSSSPSKHSEPAAICKASQAQRSTIGATLFITDPPCPNCMSALAASGIVQIIIDQAAFNGASEWYKRRARHFDQTSLQMAANGGIKLYEAALCDKSQQAALTPIITPPPTKHIDMTSSYTNKREALTQADIDAYLNGDHCMGANTKDKDAWALTLIPMGGQDYIVIQTQTCTTLIDGDRRRLMKASKGWQDLSIDQQDKALNKYKRQIYPLDLMRYACAREGIKITPNTHIISSQVPASREQVNLCDILPYIQLHVMDSSKTWMPTDQQALSIFKASGAGLRIAPSKRQTNDVIG